MHRVLVLAALLVALPAGAVTIDWVPIGNAGNAADTPSTNCSVANCGSVGNPYFISKYEVTNAEYAEFLNAKAASDPLGLYNTNMDVDPKGGITRSGSEGGYVYAAKAGFESKPVVYVSFWDALRFANWLHNGQGSSDTETGAYTITSDGIANNTIMRNPGAIAFLPSENEWYKAAYYDPALPGYYDYPAGTDTPITCATPGTTSNTANCLFAVNGLTDVGSYTGSASPYGTFDQGGNVWEWNEEIAEIAAGPYRVVRGGCWTCANDSAGVVLYVSPPTGESNFHGFRVASLPEPGQVLLALTGGLVLAVARRKRRA